MHIGGEQTCTRNVICFVLSMKFVLIETAVGFVEGRVGCGALSVPVADPSFWDVEIGKYFITNIYTF